MGSLLYICTMRHFTVLIGFISLLFLSWRPQPVQMETTSSYFPWEPVGPSNLGHIFTAGLRVGNKIYVGTAYGGLYVSEDNARSWRLVPGFSLNQNGEAVYRSPAVSALAASEGVLYVGTGTTWLFNPAGVSIRNIDSLRAYIPGAFALPGMGVFISQDNGQTFSNQNATWGLTYPDVRYSARYYGAMQVTNIVDIAVSGDNVAVLMPDSVLISNDRLQTVRKIFRLPDGKPLRSIAWGANNTLFIATSDNLYRTSDEGETLDTLTKPSIIPLPAGVNQYGGGMMRVRSAPSNPSVIYLASSDGNGRLVSVWVSPDNGQSWTQLAVPQNASFNVLDQNSPLSLALRVDPRDHTRILIGGLQIWEFTPERGWQRINPPNIALSFPVLNMPRPIRDFVFLEDGSFLVIGTGRLIRIRDNGTYAENADRGIQSAAVLSVAVAPNGDVHASGLSPLNLGFHYTESDPPQLFRLGNFPAGVFAPVAAPIGNLAVSYRDPATVVFAYNEGRLRQSRERGAEYVSIYNPPAPISFYKDTIQSSRSASGQDRPERFGPLYPPILLIEELPELIQGRDRTIYGKSYFFIATSARLWFMSNFIPPNVDSLQYWSPVTNVPISNVTSSTTYATYFSATNTIPTAMGGSMLPDSSITVWIGTSNGRLYRIQEAQDITLDRSSSKNLEDLTSAISGLVDGRTISAIAVHPNNPDLVAIAVSSYRTPVDRIFLSTNATSANPTFTSIHANLPNIPVYSLFFHPDSSALLLAGTHWGLWRCADVNNPQWEEMTGEIVGRVPVTSITWKPLRYQVDTVDRSDPDNILTEARLLPDPERPIYIGTWGRGVWKISSRAATSLPMATAAQGIRFDAFPNPFSSEINIKVALPSGARSVSWHLLNINGQRIATHSHQATLSSGEHTFRWNPGALAQGIYFIQLEVIDTQGKRYTETRKLLRQ